MSAEQVGPVEGVVAAEELGAVEEPGQVEELVAAEELGALEELAAGLCQKHCVPEARLAGDSSCRRASLTLEAHRSSSAY